MLPRELDALAGLVARFIRRGLREVQTRAIVDGRKRLES